MATFWEIAARSVSNLFSLYFVYLLYLFISRFGFKSEICLLIAPVLVHCFSITFFPGVNHNTIIDLIPNYFCRILIQGSDTLSLETNQNISGMFSNSLMNLGVSITTMKTMHTTSSDMTFKRLHTLTHTHACMHAHIVSLSLSLSLSLSFSISLSLSLRYMHSTGYVNTVYTLCNCVY